MSKSTVWKALHDQAFPVLPQSAFMAPQSTLGSHTVKLNAPSSFMLPWLGSSYNLCPEYGCHTYLLIISLLYWHNLCEDVPTLPSPTLHLSP